MSDNSVSGGETELSTSTGPTPVNEENDVDMLFRTLASERRRHVLYHLSERDDAVAVDDLAEHLAGALNGGPALSEAVERARVGLHHNHLPKLEEAGIVVERNGFVELDDGGDADRALAVLEQAERVGAD